MALPHTNAVASRRTPAPACPQCEHFTVDPFGCRRKRTGRKRRAPAILMGRSIAHFYAALVRFRGRRSRRGAQTVPGPQPQRSWRRRGRPRRLSRPSVLNESAWVLGFDQMSQRAYRRGLRGATPFVAATCGMAALRFASGRGRWDAAPSASPTFFRHFVNPAQQPAQKRRCRSSRSSPRSVREPCE